MFKIRISFIAFIVCISFIFCCSCQNKEERIVREWWGKTIKFPTSRPFTTVNKDTIDMIAETNNQKKILVYVDSLNCTECQLNFGRWKDFLIDVNKLRDNKIKVLFYITTDRVKSIRKILTEEDFQYPVCMDKNDSINILNSFPKNPRFRTFLLDEGNKIILIGNPTTSQSIKQLYLNNCN